MVLGRKKLRLACKVSFILIILMIFGCKPANNIWIDKEQSFFSNFKIIDEKVYMKCELVIQNTYNINKNIKLTATSEKDKQSGLLTDDIMIGYDNNCQTDIFTIVPGTNKLSVYFVGSFGGMEIKYDRLLPQIEIELSE